MRSLLAAGLFLFAIAAGPAEASTGQAPNPEKTKLLSLQARAYWVKQVDAQGNAIVRTPDGNAAVMLGIYASDEAPDDVARTIATRLNAAALRREQPVSIAGHDGQSYHAEAMGTQRHADIRLIVAPTEPGYVLVVTVVTTDALSGAEFNEISHILDNVKIAAAP